MEAMPKIVFMGAGSTVFVKSIIGDSMLTPALRDSEVALYDIDHTRLKESLSMLQTLNENVNSGRIRLKGFLGVKNRKAASLPSYWRPQRPRPPTRHSGTTSPQLTG